MDKHTQLRVEVAATILARLAGDQVPPIAELMRRQARVALQYADILLDEAKPQQKNRREAA